MLVAIDSMPSSLFPSCRVSDGDVDSLTLGRAQCTARRHRNAASNLVVPFVDPGHVESHPVPGPVETQRGDDVWSIHRKPIADEFGRIGLGHVTPSATISAMPLTMAVTPPSFWSTDVRKERAVDRIFHIQLGVHGVLLIFGLVMFSALHRGRSS
jgi:hypothetical protein